MGEEDMVAENYTIKAALSMAFSMPAVMPTVRQYV
jgi:hypothetical protein